MDPSGISYYYWSALVMVAVLFNLVMVIVRSVFPQPHEGWLLAVWFPLDYTADIIYLLDMFAKSRIGISECFYTSLSQATAFAIRLHVYLVKTQISLHICADLSVFTCLLEDAFNPWL